jgi:4-amino-4-deoxy-L-arabinose transferase
MLGTLFPALLSVLHCAAAGKEIWKKVWKNDLWRFALCSVVLPFCFFSASKGKLATYILPCFPFTAAALTLPAREALRAERRGVQLALRWLFDILGWSLVVFGAGVVVFALALLPPWSLRRLIPALMNASPMFILLGAAAAAGGIWQIRHRGDPRRRIAGFFGVFALTMGTLAAMPDFGSEKMPERDLRRLAASGEFDTGKAMIFTYGQMGHTVAWALERSDTRLLFSSGEMEYGEKQARRDGKPLLLSEGVKGEFAHLIRDPERREQVVYIAPVTEEEKKRYKWLVTAFKPRRVDRGGIMALIFDPVTSSRRAAPAAPKSSSPAQPAR